MLRSLPVSRLRTRLMVPLGLRNGAADFKIRHMNEKIPQLNGVFDCGQYLQTMPFTTSFGGTRVAATRGNGGSRGRRRWKSAYSIHRAAIDGSLLNEAKCHPMTLPLSMVTRSSEAEPQLDVGINVGTTRFGKSWKGSLSDNKSQKSVVGNCMDTSMESCQWRQCRLSHGGKEEELWS